MKNGDSAIIAFSAASAGANAKSIRVLAEGVWPHLSGSVNGKVGAIDASSITVQTENNGPQKFGIIAKTKSTVFGQKATLDQIKVGDNILVGFKVLDDGSRVANSGAAGRPTRPRFDPHVNRARILPFAGCGPG